MSPKQKLANTLRKLADRVDPPTKARESSVELRPAAIEQLLGFEQVEPVDPGGDWTWTQGSRTGYL